MVRDTLDTNFVESHRRIRKVSRQSCNRRQWPESLRLIREQLELSVSEREFKISTALFSIIRLPRLYGTISELAPFLEFPKFSLVRSRGRRQIASFSEILVNETEDGFLDCFDATRTKQTSRNEMIGRAIHRAPFYSPDTQWSQTSLARTLAV